MPHFATSQYGNFYMKSFPCRVSGDVRCIGHSGLFPHHPPPSSILLTFNACNGESFYDNFLFILLYPAMTSFIGIPQSFHRR